MLTRNTFTFVAAAALAAAAMASPLDRRQIGRKPTEVVLTRPDENVNLNSSACDDFKRTNPNPLLVEKYVALPGDQVGRFDLCGRYITLLVGGDNTITDVLVIGESMGINQEQMVASTKVWNMLLDKGQNQDHDNTLIRYVAGWIPQYEDDQGQDDDDHDDDQDDDQDKYRHGQNDHSQTQVSASASVSVSVSIH